MPWGKPEWTLATQIAQTVVIAIGIPFAAYQLRVGVQQLRATSDASSAVALGTIMNASADLQWRILQEPSLHGIWVPGVKADGLARDKKLDVLRGMLISNYAFIFNVHQLGQIPEDSWSAMTADMHEFFARDDNRKRWEQVKQFYQGEFRSFVENDLLHTPK